MRMRCRLFVPGCIPVHSVCHRALEAVSCALGRVLTESVERFDPSINRRFRFDWRHHRLNPANMTLSESSYSRVEGGLYRPEHITSARDRAEMCALTRNEGE